MKCPKCSYLGFETGVRCKNCGYDFSLIAAGPLDVPALDPVIRTDDMDASAPELWLDQMDRHRLQIDLLDLATKMIAGDAYARPRIRAPGAARSGPG